MNRLKRIIIWTVFIIIGIIVSKCNSNNTTTSALNPKEFLPDTTFETQFPWDDVKLCFKLKLESNNFKNHDICPKCKLKSEELMWIKFRSPGWTWQKLCGREGPLSICPKCKIQVEFITEIMN